MTWWKPRMPDPQPSTINHQLEPMISVQQLSYYVPGKVVLRRLDLEVAKGETVAVMGLSGSGKSTLLKCLAGLLRPRSGRILIEDTDITAMTEDQMIPIRRRIGLVFQYSALFDSLTIFENVAFSLRRHRRLPPARLRETVMEKLAIVGLPGVEDKYPSQLSGGMQKRAALARALALDPDVLLYDEPTAGLDPIMSAAIDELIVRMREDLSVTSVLVSHDISSIFRVASRAAMLHDGRIIAEGAPDEIRRSDNKIVRQFVEGRSAGPIQPGAG